MTRLAELISVEDGPNGLPVLTFRDLDGALWRWTPTGPDQLADVLRGLMQPHSDNPGPRLFLAAIAECQSGRPYSSMHLTKTVLEVVAAARDSRSLVACPPDARRSEGPRR